MWCLTGHTSVTLIMLNDVVVIFLFEIASVNTLHLPLDPVGEHTRNQFRLSDLLNYNTTLILSSLSKNLRPRKCSFSAGKLFFVGVEALRLSQHFFSHVGIFSWVEPVLSKKDETYCSRIQHRAPVRFDPATLQSRVWHSTN